MPNQDGMGPMGKGPMSGRRMGICSNIENESNEDKFKNGFNNRCERRGRKGRKHNFRSSQISKEESLIERKEFLEAQLEKIDNILSSKESN